MKTVWLSDSHWSCHMKFSWCFYKSSFSVWHAGSSVERVVIHFSQKLTGAWGNTFANSTELFRVPIFHNTKCHSYLLIPNKLMSQCPHFLNMLPYWISLGEALLWQLNQRPLPPQTKIWTNSYFMQKVNGTAVGMSQQSTLCQGLPSCKICWEQKKRNRIE